MLGLVHRSCLSLTRSMASGSKMRHLLFAITCAALLALCSLFVFVTYQARQDVRRQIETSAANLASAVAHDVDRNFELLDLSLQALKDAWGNPDVQGLAPLLQQKVLFDHSASAQDTGLMLVLDQDGIVRASSRELAPKRDNFSDRDYFRVHIRNGDVGLFVSKPFVSRLTGRWTLALSRRISNADGSFHGVALATLQLAYLDRLYAGLNLDAGGSITLFRTDGTVVTRKPYVEADINRSFRASDGFTRIRSLKVGSIEGESPIDGLDRLISFHRVGDLPLIQVVEVSSDDAYAAWWRKSLIVGGVLGLLCLSSVSLLLLLYAELRRRIEIEAVLARLAGTDGLTEVANRRRFDEALNSEWQRAIREHAEISLLMIDADHFKSFNDTFGHLKGDDILRTLARCIASNVHRPGDLVARYGGEEFSVLLPNTGSAGALAVAEAIRLTIAGRAEQTSTETNRVVTVSIGIGSLRPEFGDTSADLVTGADSALYLAKAEGRNCCRTAGLDRCRLVAA